MWGLLFLLIIFHNRSEKVVTYSNAKVFTPALTLLIHMIIILAIGLHINVMYDVNILYKSYK